MKPSTLGQLKAKSGSPQRPRSVKEEIRSNLLAALQKRDPLFPEIVGYRDTVIPALVNALLSRHNFILLGLRGQAKSRILRGLTRFLDPEIAVIEGCEIHDDPFFPICSACTRRLEEAGEDLPITYLDRESRFVEKLATPDVTIADIIGDLDPIRAARTGRQLSDQTNIHFGLLPRAHRGIFVINELPDLAPKIQVGLFNVMQEGDVQIKGFPLRLPLDVLLAFSANPEDYTARGKIITPLKDRIGSEIHTHYPETIEGGMRITGQESWLERNLGRPTLIPSFIREVVEGVAFQGRRDKRVDRRSGVSQRLPIACLENTLSNAERRALLSGEERVVPRISDIYAALPALTGKLELEYEGELQGAQAIAAELIRAAVGEAFRHHFPGRKFDQIVEWFNLGGEIKVSDQTPAREYLGSLLAIQGIETLLEEKGVSSRENPEMAVSMMEFVLEGLYARGRISRSDEKGYFKTPERREDLDPRVALRKESYN